MGGKPNSEGGYPSYEGSAKTTYDGVTVTGPPEGLGSVARCKSRPVKVPKLKATAKSLGGSRYSIKVTVSMPRAGANQGGVDTRPVKRARLKVGKTLAFTNGRGVALIKATRGAQLKVTAGDTLRPTSRRIR